MRDPTQMGGGAPANSPPAEFNGNPFFFDELITPLSRTLKEQGRYLRGFRGAGKTHILRAFSVIAESMLLMNRSLRDRPIISPLDRSAEEIDIVLRDIARSKGSKGVVLIDDLDLLLEHSQKDGLDRWDSLSDSLERIFTRLENVHILFTTTRNPVDIGTRNQMLSNFLQNAREQPLEPWKTAEEWHRKVRDILGASLGGDACSTDVVAKGIVILSGGHPTLIGAAVRRIRKTMSQSSGWIPPTRLAPVLKEIPRLLTDDGLPSIRRRILALAPDQRRALADLAGHSVGYRALLERRIGEELTNAGLVRRHDGHREGQREYSIPSPLIREEASAELSSRVDDFVLLDPSTSNPDQEGAVVAGSGSTTRIVSLSGRSWQLARVLYDNAGKPLAPDELNRLLGELVTETGKPFVVHAALQRLRSSLKNELPNLLQTHRGSGYLFDVPQLRDYSRRPSA